MSDDSLDASSSVSVWSTDFCVILVATFFVYFSFSMLLPTLPTYVFAMGGSEGVVGLVISALAMAALVTRPLIGRELDRRDRSVLYRFGLVVFVLAVLAYRWAEDPARVAVVRLVHGVAWGVITTASATVVSDLVPPARRGEGMGYYGLSMNLAGAVAPATGLYLISRYSYPVLFYVSTTAALAALCVSLRLGPDRPVATTELIERGLFALYEWRTVLPALLGLLLCFSNSGINTFLQIYARGRGVSNVGLFFTLHALALICVRPVAGRVFDRHGPRTVVTLGFFLVAIALVVISLASSLTLFIVGGALYGTGSGAVLPSLQALAVEGVRPERRGAANATYTSALDIGVGAGNIALGVVAQWQGISNMYLLTSGLVALGLVVFLMHGRGRTTGRCV